MQTNIGKELRELEAHTVYGGYEDAGKTFRNPFMYKAGTDGEKAWEAGYKLYAIEMRYYHFKNIGETDEVLDKIHQEITDILNKIKNGEIK